MRSQPIGFASKLGNTAANLGTSGRFCSWSGKYLPEELRVIAWQLPRDLAVVGSWFTKGEAHHAWLTKHITKFNK